MTLNKFVFKTHKWLAVGVTLFTLVWFASGIVMVLPRNLLGKPGSNAGGNSGAPDFKSMAFSASQAIAAAEAAAGKNILVTSVDLRAIEGRIYYHISTAKSGTYLFDAESGARLKITEDYAKQMALRYVGGQGPLQESGMLRAHGIEYGHGTLPVYRFAFADPAATIVYIDPVTGNVQSSDRNGRVRAFIVGTHTFEFFHPMMGTRWSKVVLIFFSFVGLVMSGFGTWILWIQFQNWRARRAGRPEAA